MPLTEQDRLVMRGIGLQNFFMFVKMFGAPVKQGADISPVVHRALCDFAQDDSIKRKGISLGRNLRKTTTFTRWMSIWKYLRNPEVRILICAQSLDIARGTIGWIKKQITQNALLRWCYPELEQINDNYANSKKHAFSDTEVELPRQGIYAEPTFRALGAGSALQGRHFTDLHLTDIINEKTLASPILMEKAQLWCDNLQELLVEPDWRSSTGSTIQVDASLYATGDTYDYIMSAYPHFQWIIAPALKMSDEDIKRAKAGRENVVFVQSPDVGVLESNFGDILNDETGRPLFSTEMYQAMMADPQAERIFWSQHQCVPSFGASQTNPFKHDWLRWYDLKAGPDGKTWIIVCHEPQGDVEIPFTRFMWMGIIDPGGFSEHSIKGSRCAMLIAGQDRESPRKVVLWTWAKRVVKPSEFFDALYGADNKWHPRGFKIETFAQQAWLMRDVWEESERRGKRLNISALPKDTGANAKEGRIDGLRDGLARGEWFLHNSMKDLIAEIMGYPSALTNDLIDAMSYFDALYGSGLSRKNVGRDADKRYREYLSSKNPTTGY